MDYHKINLKGISKHNMAKKEKKGPGLWAEFKEFINRGNAFMLAVGVVIGGAFGAIVNAFVNILLSLATWAVPGGLKGLVTVLPALNDAQRGPVGQSFQMKELVDKTVAFAESQGVAITKDSDTFVQWQTALLGKYTQHGTTFTFNGAAVPQPEGPKKVTNSPFVISRLKLSTTVVPSKTLVTPCSEIMIFSLSIFSPPFPT